MSSAGQRQDSSSLIDASEIDIEAMGQFDMGGSSRKSSDSDSDSGSFPGMGGSDFSGRPSGSMPSGDGGSFPSFSENGFGNTSSKMQNIIIFSVMLALMLLALLIMKKFSRSH